MQATLDAQDLSPPDGGRWRVPLTTALGVHGLLVLALTWGVGWQRDTVVVAEAELWSRLPQQAAPKAVEPEPKPQPEPTPEPVKPAPEPPKPPPPTAQDAQIALQKKQAEEKLKQLAEQKRQEAQRKAELKAQQERQEKLAREKQAQAERERQARQEAQLEAERKKNLERMMGQANATGGATAKGTAAQSSGPSASYAGKLVARVRPNIVFTDIVSGNPRAEVEVRALPDGTILGSRLLKSSGHAGWDDAVLRAIQRTGKLPQDENGRVPGTLILGFRPQG